MKFRDCQPEDAEAISEMAARIWPQVYSEMISVEQIEFMLKWMYSPQKIREDLKCGVTYFFIESEAGKTAGYAAFGPDANDPGTWLHKLYVDPEFHRQGLASCAISEIRRRIGIDEKLWLRVNRGNTTAIAAYKKNGFSTVEERCSDIGGGFVMDDFIMRL
ncbi:MAG: N-acetyltransferase family protein [Verrucomicrobiales bacterium]